MPTWQSSLGNDTASDISLDTMGDLTDGRETDNLWTAQRVNVLKDGLLEVERILLGNAAAKNITALTSKVNADLLDGKHGSEYYLKTDEVSATTFDGHPSSYYYNSGQLITFTSSIGIAVDNAAGGGYTYLDSFTSPFTAFCYPATVIMWGADGANGHSAGDTFAASEVVQSITNRLPYVTTTGAILMGSVQYAFGSGVRFSAKAYGAVGVNRVFFSIIFKGI